jgi:hypothetical protein
MFDRARKALALDELLGKPHRDKIGSCHGRLKHERPSRLAAGHAITQFVVPVLIAAVFIVEITGVTSASPTLEVAYNYLIAIAFSLLTVVMIGVCGWIVFLWDIDRLFFRLERKIDAQVAATASFSLTHSTKRSGSAASNARPRTESQSGTQADVAMAHYPRRR